MFDLWGNILLEIGLFAIFGVLYYFYQKRKIMHYEANKGPIIMEMILQSCLSDKNDSPQPELDGVIEALDDYLQKKSDTAPTALLNQFAQSGACSPELKNVIVEGLEEYGKK